MRRSSECGLVGGTAVRAGMLGAVGAVLATSAATADCVSYSGFSDVSGLTINGIAEVVTTGDGEVLRLSRSQGSVGGSAFLSTPVSAATFSTRFVFRITDPGGSIFDCNTVAGADGLVFVVQTVSDTVGGVGLGIGYGGIAPSIGIEFDNWCNAGLNDPSPNHVGIDVDGDVNHGAGAPYTATIEPDFENGELWYAWIDYDGTAVEVRVSTTDVRPDEPVVTRELDLATILGQETAFIGFTSATGAAWANHDIVEWQYDRFIDPDCPDLDLDGQVGFEDLLEILALWGPFTTGCVPDFDANGQIDFNDLLVILASWGPCG